MTLTTAGHVDHGKSTLLQALTGTDPDRLAEEHRRGVSIALGFVWCTLEATDEAPTDIEVAFVDVPGHERFVATMLAGVGPATASLLVVAADDGWSAQTQEHAEVLALLNIPVVATVLSKAAVAGRERTGQVAQDLTRRLRAMGLDGGPVVETDAVTGQGLDRLRRVLRTRIAALPTPADHRRPRLCIDRAFVVAGAGTVVTGTLGGGGLRVGDRVRLAPDATTGRVRGLAALGAPVDLAAPGERVAVNLAGVSHEHVARGQALVTTPDGYTTSVVDGWATILPGRTVRDRGAWQVYAGTARTTARLLPFPAPIETSAARDGTGPDGTPDTAVVGGAGAVRVVLTEPLPLRVGDVLVIRDTGRHRVVGAIRVADPHPLRLPRGRPRREAHARTVHLAAHSDGAGMFAALVALHGGVRAREDLRAATGHDLIEVPHDVLVTLGDTLVEPGQLRRWQREVANLGAGAHSRGEVAGAARKTAMPEGLLDAFLQQLVAQGTLTVTDAGYVLADHVDEDTRRRAARREALIAALEATPFAPPALEEAARLAGTDAQDVAALVRQGQLVRAGPVAFSGAAVAAARNRLAASPLARRPFTAGEARGVLGTSRRYIIPLLEHLASIGATSFDGSHHQLRDAPGT